MNSVTIDKISQNEYYNVMSPFILDLLAVYSLMYEDVINKLDEAVKNEWDNDRLIKEIESLI